MWCNYSLRERWGEIYYIYSIESFGNIFFSLVFPTVSKTKIGTWFRVMRISNVLFSTKVTLGMVWSLDTTGKRFWNFPVKPGRGRITEGWLHVEQPLLPYGKSEGRAWLISRTPDKVIFDFRMFPLSLSLNCFGRHFPYHIFSYFHNLFLIFWLSRVRQLKSVRRGTVSFTCLELVFKITCRSCVFVYLWWQVRLLYFCLCHCCFSQEH